MLHGVLLLGLVREALRLRRVKKNVAFRWNPAVVSLQRASLADGLRVRGVPAIPLLCVV